jgi:hypothetical protein
MSYGNSMKRAIRSQMVYQYPQQVAYELPPALLIPGNVNYRKNIIQDRKIRYFGGSESPSGGSGFSVGGFLSTVTGIVGIGTGLMSWKSGQEASAQAQYQALKAQNDAAALEAAKVERIPIYLAGGIVGLTIFFIGLRGVTKAKGKKR